MDASQFVSSNPIYAEAEKTVTQIVEIAKAYMK